MEPVKLKNWILSVLLKKKKKGGGVEGKRRIYDYTLHLSNNIDNVQDGSPAMFHCLVMQMHV